MILLEQQLPTDVNDFFIRLAHRIRVSMPRYLNPCFVRMIIGEKLKFQHGKIRRGSR